MTTNPYDYGESPHRWSERGEYVGPYQSIDEMPAPAPLSPAHCSCGDQLDDAGACLGCGVIGNCQCEPPPST